MTRSRRMITETIPALAVAAAVIAGAAAANQYGLIHRGLRINWFDTLPLYLGAFWYSVRFLVGLIEERRERALSIFHGKAWLNVAKREASAPRVLSSASLLLILVPFMSSFAALKRSIPYWRPFAFDDALHQVDLLIHGGVPAWHWLVGLLRHDEAVLFLDRVYYLWFPVVLITTAWFACSSDTGLRTRFFTAFFSCWALLGVGLAAILSSAGPCFFEQVVPRAGRPYADLLARLQDVSGSHTLTALEVQDYLWTGYSSDSYVVEGISAMPSMHVSIAALLCLASFGAHRLLGLLFLAFLVLILVGSVALGWHYAVDGYASILLTTLIWRLTKFADGSRIRCRGQVP